MFFDNVPRGPPDVMYRLKHRADNDPHPQKIDLGVGIYRNEEGRYHELQAVTQVCVAPNLLGVGDKVLTSTDAAIRRRGMWPRLILGMM